jgi:hypothetical protein
MKRPLPRAIVGSVRGIALEGIRQQFRLNATEFASSDEVIDAAGNSSLLEKPTLQRSRERIGSTKEVLLSFRHRRVHPSPFRNRP